MATYDITLCLLTENLFGLFESARGQTGDYSEEVLPSILNNKRDSYLQGLSNQSYYD